MAALLAPILFAVCFFWMFLVPVFAVVLGAPSYFGLALPIFAIALWHHDAGPSEIALIGILVNLATLPVIYLIQPEAMSVYAVLGSIHAPVWAATFGFLYRRFRRAPFTTPVFQ